MRITGVGMLAIALIAILAVHLVVSHTDYFAEKNTDLKDVVRAEYSTLAAKHPLIAAGIANVRFARPWECTRRDMPKIQESAFMEAYNGKLALQFNGLCDAHAVLVQSNNKLVGLLEKGVLGAQPELYRFYIRRLDESRLSTGEGNTIGLINTQYDDTPVGYFYTMRDCRNASEHFLVSNIQVRGCEKALTVERLRTSQ